MRLLPEQEKTPELLVGNETSDDAGVYQLTDSIALIQTIDYFTPVVDDPYMFGQISAANALSDVYAMGGKPLTAMNMVGYPIKKLGSEMLAEILRGAADKVKEAGAITVGGHSIDDQEPKFGLSVSGIVHPEKIWKNVGAVPGDVLILTKPIGVGLLTRGIKHRALTKEQEKKATETMALLNKKAAEVLNDFTPSAVTDVTGFGLLGHGSEMARGSNVSFVINMDKVPLLDGALELAQKKVVLYKQQSNYKWLENLLNKMPVLIRLLELAGKGVIPSGTKSNHKWLKGDVDYNNITIEEQFILCDTITSGGLLISLNPSEAERYVQALKDAGQDCWVIGEVINKQEKLITINR